MNKLEMIDMIASPAGRGARTGPRAEGNWRGLRSRPDPGAAPVAPSAWTDETENPPAGPVDPPLPAASPSLAPPFPEGSGPAGRTAAAPAEATVNRPVEVAIIQRYRRRQGSMEEALLEIYHAGLSLGRAEATARALWGAHVTVATVCDRYQQVASRIDAWRRRPIRGRHAYVYLGAVELERGGRGGEGKIRVLAAVGINEHGLREVLGVFARADRHGWPEFLHQLKARGLTGVRLFVSEPGAGIAEGIHDAYPRARHQICAWRFQHDLLAQVPIAQLVEAAETLNAIYASASPKAARAQALRAARQLRRMGLPPVASVLASTVGPTLRFFDFPRDHWRSLRASSLLVRILRQIGARARRLRMAPDEISAGLIVSAGLRCMADQWAASRTRLDMRPLGGRRARSRPGGA